MAANDRSYLIGELQKLVKYSDRRIRAIIFTMASSGIRLGAWDYLKWKHVTTLERENTLVAAKLIVYAGEAEEYYTFITPEAYHSLKEWMDYRELHGEKLTPESWLMRDLWQTTDTIERTKRGGNYGLATYPKKIDLKAVKKIINRALRKQGLRQALPDGKRRHEFKEMHAFRKFFQTRAEQVMKHINVELLMGHNLGLTGSYYKPQEAEVLSNYLKAVLQLTIIDITPIKDLEKERERDR